MFEASKKAQQVVDTIKASNGIKSDVSGMFPLLEQQIEKISEWRKKEWNDKNWEEGAKWVIMKINEELKSGNYR